MTNGFRIKGTGACDEEEYYIENLHLFKIHTNGLEIKLVDHVKNFTKHIEFRQKLKQNDVEENEVNFKTILNPEMIGLTDPKQDLDNLKDFSKCN